MHKGVWGMKALYRLGFCGVAPAIPTQENAKRGELLHIQICCCACIRDWGTHITQSACPIFERKSVGPLKGIWDHFMSNLMLESCC